MLYEWRLPSDLAPLRSAIDAVIAGEVEIVAFTSQIQVRHLFEVADAERHVALVEALNRMLVGAVGPTCAAACHAVGIQSVAVPERPKLAPLLQLLAHEWTARAGFPHSR
jgi:uroporphyrinogen-III synthase